MASRQREDDALWMPLPRPVAGTRSAPAPRAYTLIELLIVIVIMAILAMVAIPSFSSSLGQQRALAAAERIRADLAWARECAIAANSTKSVAFAVGTGRYTLVGIPDPNGQPGTYVVDLNKADLQIEILSANFGGSDTVYFDAFGKAMAGGQIRLASQGVVFMVNVEATSGLAEVAK